MYGQTEASPRMSYLDFKFCEKKIGSIGKPLIGGKFKICDDNKKIINQVIRGLTPPMPSFEIEPQSMADLLEYMHSLN